MTRLIYLILLGMPWLVHGHKCPPAEDIMPCRCRGRNEQVQVWCSHSDLERVNGALENLMRLRNMPAIDELIVENNRMPTLPARAFGALQIGRLLLRNNGLESISRNAFAGLEDSLQEIYIVEDKLVDFPFDSIENLRNLEAFTVERSKIRLLPRFNGLNRLKHIRIDGSHISGFPVGAFASMASIKQVHVVNSNVATLAEGIFGPLDSLILANFSGNRIDFIQRRCFALLPKLEVLSLSNNQLTDSVIVGRATEELPSLKSLDLSLNKFKVLPEASFVNLKSLQMLNLAMNKIQIVGPRSITYLPALRKVDLSHNELRNFPPLFFDSVPLLEELRLRKNQLGTANELGEMLRSLKSLRFLDLGENGITELPTGAIQDHSHLQRLDLSDNKITRIQRGAFKNVPSLMEMSLRNNTLKELSYEAEPIDIPSLKELDLSSNNIQQLPPSALKGFTGLARMDLSHNSIKTLGAHNFGNNRDLELLEISNNGLNSIAGDAFSGLSKLNKLDIGRNHIEHLQAGTFRDLRNLQTLNVGNNRLNNLPNNLFQELRSLEDLSMKGNSINHVPQGLFTSFENMKELNMKNNAIAELQGKTFATMKNLETLKLSSNQISRFDESAFDDMPKLRTLDISSNRINKLPPRSFKNLLALEKFEARENRITSIDSTAFSSSSNMHVMDLAHNALTSVPDLVKANPSMKVIDLSHNHIVKVEPAIFRQSKALMELYLNDNRVKDLSPKTFENMPTLTILDMDGNEMEEIPSEAFRNLPKLIYLRMSRNRIRHIRSAAFSDLNSLDGVDLQENELETVADTAFDRTAALKYLNLSHNNFDNFNKMGLLPLQSLEVLDTSFNKLRDVDDKGMRHLQWLVELRMNDNGICHLPIGMFDGMSRLKMLVVRNNHLSHLYESVFYKLRNNIAYMDLSGNPLNCDCELVWLRNMMAREAVHELNASTCAFPNDLKGFPVKNIRPGRMICPNNGISKGLPPRNYRADKCPELVQSRRRARPGPDVSERPLFGSGPGIQNVYGQEATEINDVHHRKKDEKQIESNDYVPGDTPTIYAGSSSSTSNTKISQHDLKKSNSILGGLGSFFGIPLDFGLNLGISPSVSVADKKQEDSSRAFGVGIKGHDPLPPSWIQRPEKVPGNLYEPPEYIPRKPHQPYIPLNPYAESGVQANVLPSGSVDVHKAVPPSASNLGRRPFKFPGNTGPSPQPQPPRNHPQQSWHPSYPNTETGFIPIEPFFHSVASNKKKPTEYPQDELLRPSVSTYYSSTSRPIPFNSLNSERPKSTNIPYGLNPFESVSAAPPLQEDYEEDTSGAPDTTSTSEESQPEEDFSLSDFWSMFSNNGSKPTGNPKETSSIAGSPVNFSAPIDTSTNRPPHIFATTIKTGMGLNVVDDPQQDGPTDHHAFGASSQIPHDAHSRRPVGKPTITKVTVEETTGPGVSSPYRNSNSIGGNINSGGERPSLQEVASTQTPLIPPVVIGNQEEPLDWYYTNYNNQPQNEEQLEQFLERSRTNELQEEFINLSPSASGTLNENSAATLSKFSYSAALPAICLLVAFRIL